MADEKEKWIVVIHNQGMGHYGLCAITTEAGFKAGEAPIVDNISEANARRIVQAVNNYDDLVGALKETLAQIEFSHKTKTGYGHWSPIHNYIKQLLAQIEKEG